MSLRLLVHGFEIGDRSIAARTPVHHVLAAIDETFFVQAHEGFADGAGESRIEGKTFAAPVATGAEPAHLIVDSLLVNFLPFPDLFDKFLAPELFPGDALLGQLALYDHLRCDSGVIGSGHPERVVASHAMPADCHVD